MSVFDVSSGDIAALGDEALRALVGRLCEAELRIAGDPASAARWGGDQNAADGGLDVEVVLPNPSRRPDFLPRQHTGIQVKKPGMAAAAIRSEMRPEPERELRPIIRQLVQDQGAYIIVSSGDDCSSSMLTNRVNAMREALATEDNPEQLHLDFYDRSRMATWTRNHPAMVLWVRERVGRPLSGWRPFGAWTRVPAGIEDGYLDDDVPRFLEANTTAHQGLTALQGVQRVRECLSVSGSTARLIGLSGVGKTRFVQALFEASVGHDAIDPALAIYADIGAAPTPGVHDMLRTLLALRQRFVVVIDNCSPEVHRQLIEVLNAQHTEISLLTVEYDVTDDEPEETRVFRLARSGEHLVETLVRRRFPHIDSNDAHAIAVFSGGNPRIALVLANTVEDGDSVGRMRDAELFRRLFHQRHPQDHTLLEQAEVLSLVYSYHGESTSDQGAELAVLGGLIGESAVNMYRASAELASRELVQGRGVWRALLPHAIANRLAHQALQRIPLDYLCSTFVAEGRERLLKSFTRRLSYLHESPEAQAIAARWLGDGGFLGAPGTLSAVQCSVSTILAGRRQLSWRVSCHHFLGV